MEKELVKKTKKELIDYVKSQGLSGYSKLNKPELIQLLLKNRKNTPTSPAPSASANVKDRVWNSLSATTRDLLLKNFADKKPFTVQCTVATKQDDPDKILYLSVSYKDKDLVKSKGAKWNATVKKWFVVDTPENRTIFKAWIDDSAELPAEYLECARKYTAAIEDSLKKRRSMFIKASHEQGIYMAIEILMDNYNNDAVDIIRSCSALNKKAFEELSKAISIAMNETLDSMINNKPLVLPVHGWLSIKNSKTHKELATYIKRVFWNMYHKHTQFR